MQRESPEILEQGHWAQPRGLGNRQAGWGPDNKSRDLCVVALCDNQEPLRARQQCFPRARR